MGSLQLWLLLGYFLLVVWGVMFSLAEHEGKPSMWRRPTSKAKRWVLASMVPAIVLAFSNRPDEAWIIVLVIVFLAILGFGLSEYLQKAQRNIAAFVLCFSFGCTFIGIAAWHAWPVAIVPPLPLFTLRVERSSFPVFVPAHSVISIVPIHPFQAFASTAPHTFVNPCGEEKRWPSDDEISSKVPNTHEEVRQFEISNHSQITMARGSLSLPIIYNESFAGGCTPPPNPQALQYDVISVPALDNGKSFTFYAVNQTSKCAWLPPPSTMRVKMTGEDSDKEIPLKLEEDAVSNFSATPFPPTHVNWQGVPARSPGYGIVSTSAACSPPLRSKAEIKPKPDKSASMPQVALPEQSKGIALNVLLEKPTSPCIVVVNDTDNVANGIAWELVMYRTSDHGLFSYATQTLGYVKAHSTSACYAMDLNRIAYMSGAPQVSNGEEYIGSIVVDCPTCRGTTLIVGFTWGVNGWFYQVTDGNGRLFLPKKLLSEEAISKYIEYVNNSISSDKRTEIK